MELLSPAGNLETAVAAFTYGADAVYLGLKKFSARADAENFSEDELAVLIGYARSLTPPRKVYVTVNTLLYDQETDELIRTLGILRELAPDALIVQDFAVARLVRRHFPELRLHASTQMAVHNVAGMQECRRLGFERVIAARELTLNEISAMAQVPGIELEVFVHGALCYAYSGLCLLSSVLNGHSGNRGDCTYVCRNSWEISRDGRTVAKNCCLMSMKDLCLADSIGALQRNGVASVKIEGRKKSPLYVAAVTNYYRKTLDNSFMPGEREECERDLRIIFSRPWTRFNFGGEHTPEITDTATTGPRGARLGSVAAVVRAGSVNHALRLHLETAGLERHDGLQLEIPGQSRPYGFAVERIVLYQQGGNDRGQHVFTAPCGSTVEVPLPSDHPEITPGMAVYCTSSQAVRQRYQWPTLRPQLVRQRFPLDFTLNVSPERVHLTAQARLGTRLCRGEADSAPDTPFAPTRRSAAENEAALLAPLAKLGDSGYSLHQCTIDNPGQLFLPASLLNELRRQAVTSLDEARQNARSEAAEATHRQLYAGVSSGNGDAPDCLILKLDRHFLLNLFTPGDFDKIGEVLFDPGRTPFNQQENAIAWLLGRLGPGKLRIALPAVIRTARQPQWLETLRRARNLGCRQWQISNIGHLELLRSLSIAPPDSDITADWPLYATNRAAALYLLDELGLRRFSIAPDTPDDNAAELAEQFGATAEFILFQDTPLAISSVCANASLNGGCLRQNGCGFKTMTLTDRRGNRLLAVNDSCRSVYIRDRPLDRRNAKKFWQQQGARTFRLDFIWRDWSPAAVKSLFDEL